MNITGTNNSVKGLNLGLGCLALLFNSIVILVFITTKDLRKNLFYRLLFSIYFSHAINSLAVVIMFWNFLRTIHVTGVCLIIPNIASAARVFSIGQIGIVALDRYQSSLTLTKTEIGKRRAILGNISIAFCLLVILTFSLLGAIFGKGDCIYKMFYGEATFTISRMITCWIIVCVFFVEIPLCILTFRNIRKMCTTVGIQVPLSTITTTSNENSSVSAFPNSISQANTTNTRANLKIKALIVISILVVTHATIFIPQVVVMVAYINNDNRRDILYDIFVLLQAINLLTDPITCFVTVRPLKQQVVNALMRLFCIRIEGEQTDA